MFATFMKSHNKLALEAATTFLKFHANSSITVSSKDTDDFWEILKTVHTIFLDYILMGSFQHKDILQNICSLIASILVKKKQPYYNLVMDYASNRNIVGHPLDIFNEDIFLHQNTCKFLVPRFILFYTICLYDLEEECKLFLEKDTCKDLMQDKRSSVEIIYLFMHFRAIKCCGIACDKMLKNMPNATTEISYLKQEALREGNSIVLQMFKEYPFNCIYKISLSKESIPALEWSKANHCLPPSKDLKEAMFADVESFKCLCEKILEEPFISQTPLTNSSPLLHPCQTLPNDCLEYLWENVTEEQQDNLLTYLYDFYVRNNDNSNNEYHEKMRFCMTHGLPINPKEYSKVAWNVFHYGSKISNMFWTDFFWRGYYIKHRDDFASNTRKVIKNCEARLEKRMHQVYMTLTEVICDDLIFSICRFM
jgi:hypothetical protein